MRNLYSDCYAIDWWIASPTRRPSRRAERLGHSSKGVISGIVEQRYGVSASCEEGTLALITVEHDRVRIGCPKPKMRRQCDALLEKIAESR